MIGKSQLGKLQQLGSRDHQKPNVSTRINAIVNRLRIKKDNAVDMDTMVAHCYLDLFGKKGHLKKLFNSLQPVSRQKVMKMLQAKANQRMVEASYILGLGHQSGEWNGFKKNENIAFQHFQRASTGNFKNSPRILVTEVYLTLAEHYHDPWKDKWKGNIQNNKKALMYYDKAAEGGDPKVQLRVSQVNYKEMRRIEYSLSDLRRYAKKTRQKLQEHGIPFSIEPYLATLKKSLKECTTKTFTWCQKAAKKNYAPAQLELGNYYLELGNYYEDGIYTKEDRDKAFNWTKKAADQGHQPAKEKLTWYSENEVGLTNKTAKFFFDFWDKCAINPSLRCLKDLEPYRVLGQYHEQGIGTRINLKKAFNYYRLSVEKNPRANGQVLLSRCFEEGIGTTINFKKAFDCLNKAPSPDSQCLHKLAEFHEKEIGTKKNPKKAFTLYKELTCLSYPPVIKDLYRCFKEGIGVQKNSITAEALFEIWDKTKDLSDDDLENYFEEIRELILNI